MKIIDVAVLFLTHEKNHGTISSVDNIPQELREVIGEAKITIPDNDINKMRTYLRSHISSSMANLLKI